MPCPIDEEGVILECRRIIDEKVLDKGVAAEREAFKLHAAGVQIIGMQVEAPDG